MEIRSGIQVSGSHEALLARSALKPLSLPPQVGLDWPLGDRLGLAV